MHSSKDAHRHLMAVGSTMHLILVRNSLKHDVSKSTAGSNWKQKTCTITEELLKINE